MTDSRLYLGQGRFLSALLVVAQVTALLLSMCVCVDMVVSADKGVSSISDSPNGYLLYMPHMGRFGNQVEHLLGAAGLAAATGRTLVVPPFLGYDDQDGGGSMSSAPSAGLEDTVAKLGIPKFTPADTIFKLPVGPDATDVEGMEGGVITAAEFAARVRNDAARGLPALQVQALCPDFVADTECDFIVASGRSAATATADGSPGSSSSKLVRAFWAEFGLGANDAPVFAEYDRFDDDGIHDGDLEAAQEFARDFPSDKYPVIAFPSAPFSFPATKDNEVWHERLLAAFSTAHHQERVHFSIRRGVAPGAYVAAHIRAATEWTLACLEMSRLGLSEEVMASAQCGFSDRISDPRDEEEEVVEAEAEEDDNGYASSSIPVPFRLCRPSNGHMARRIVAASKDAKTKTIYLAADCAKCAEAVAKAVTDIDPSLRVVMDASNGPILDLQLLTSARTFIGNCASSFSAFVRRARQVVADAAHDPNSNFGSPLWWNVPMDDEPAAYNVTMDDVPVASNVASSALSDVAAAAAAAVTTITYDHPYDIFDTRESSCPAEKSGILASNAMLMHALSAKNLSKSTLSGVHVGDLFFPELDLEEEEQDEAADYVRQQIPTEWSKTVGVTGNLKIQYAQTLTHVNLENLERVEGDLTIIDVPSLQSLSLPALLSVGGQIDIQGTGIVGSLDLVFPKLTCIGKGLMVADSDGLASLSLPKLTTVGGPLRVVNNAALKVIKLDSLKNVKGAFQLYRCPQLIKAFTWHESVKVAGSFTVAHTRLISQKQWMAPGVQVGDHPGMYPSDFAYAADIQGVDPAVCVGLPGGGLSVLSSIAGDIRCEPLLYFENPTAQKEKENIQGDCPADGTCGGGGGGDEEPVM